jgi:hypothetical protein
MDSSIESLEEDAALYDVVQSRDDSNRKKRVIIVNMTLVKRDAQRAAKAGFSPREMEQRNWERRNSKRMKSGQLLEDFPSTRRNSQQRRNSFGHAVKERVTILKREFSGLMAETAAVVTKPRSHSMSSILPPQQQHYAQAAHRGPTDTLNNSSSTGWGTFNTSQNTSMLTVHDTTRDSQQQQYHQPRYHAPSRQQLVRRHSTGMVPPQQASSAGQGHHHHQQHQLQQHFGRSYSASDMPIAQYPSMMQSQGPRGPVQIHHQRVSRRHSNESYNGRHHCRAPPPSPVSSSSNHDHSMTSNHHHMPRRHSLGQVSPTGVMMSAPPTQKTEKARYLDNLFEMTSPRPPVYVQHQG